MAFSSSVSEAVFLFWLSRSLTVSVCSTQFHSIISLRALQNSSSSTCFQFKPLSVGHGLSSSGGLMVNVMAW